MWIIQCHKFGIKFNKINEEFYLKKKKEKSFLVP